MKAVKISGSDKRSDSKTINASSVTIPTMENKSSDRKSAPSNMPPTQDLGNMSPIAIEKKVIPPNSQ